MTERPSRFTVAAEETGQTLAALARSHGLAGTWSEARKLVERGKLFVDGAVVLDDAARLRSGQTVELRASAPRVREQPPGHIVHDDAQVVVLDKPSGVSSVPYEKRETGTAMDLIRAHWRVAHGKAVGETPLHVVHRIDKDTSGLIVFAKTKLAERFLAAQFRTHAVERTYLCVVHGALHEDARRIESRLVEDRGDGLRGSTREPNRGKTAVTHVRVVERLREATLCEVKLETGKTHQIRIHLSEIGHMLVGEKVYVRNFEGAVIACDRLLLHAATLGFELPDGRKLSFESPLPEAFTSALARLRLR